MLFQMKTFEINSLQIFQRSKDNRVNITKLLKAGGKPYANWTRTAAAKKLLASVEDAVIKEKRQNWMKQELVYDFMRWLVKGELDKDLLLEKLAEPFEDEAPVTEKRCSQRRPSRYLLALLAIRGRVIDFWGQGVSRARWIRRGR